MANLKALISKGADWFAGTTNPTTKKPIEGSGLQNLGAGLKSAVAVTGISTASKVPAVTSAVSKGVTTTAKAIGGSVSTFVKANPIKSSVGALIGAGVVAGNPRGTTKAIAQTPNALFNVGKNVGEFTAEPTWQKAQAIYKENPIIAGGLTAGGLYVAGKGISSGITSLINTSAIREQTETIKTQTPQIMVPSIGTTTPQSISDNVPAMASYPAESTGVGYLTEKPQKKYVARKKTQNLNTRPIHIRNNIMIANKNG